ncbi:endonuclease/exonuclease/phosphatase family protein [Nocardioides ferulae]|uniref:endonuclease/exonuclease/phosphatase family protein n=1 Tax=Nocardioides ferulae TaxID=2340821 RepID=UPI000EADEDB9|nr:endonuclease/exonuclease/phosphatase family protein [Nocardioides ferulae]
MLSSRKRLLAAAPVAALSALLAFSGNPAVQAADPGSSDAPAKPRKPAALKVMTQNLYLGASLDPAIEAQGDTVALLQAVAGIYETAIASDFPARAAVLADTIAAEKPHVIGLQEVSKWSALRLKGEGGALPNVDFLTVLLDELEERGLSYVVASDGEDEAVSENADISAPLASETYGCPMPTSQTDVSCLATLMDRDVILVASRAPLEISAVRSGSFAHQETFSGGPLGEISFARGWTLADATFKGRKVRLLDTHLEIGRFANVQTWQGWEFVHGPAKTGPKRQLIALGDFNSAADGSSTVTYELLTSYLDDTWTQANGDAPGYTCCQNDLLSNPESQLRERIDLILTKGTRGTAWARVVGDQPVAGASDGPRYAADHAGVVAKVRLR